jgi:small-conductance mechanosensitive channel
LPLTSPPMIADLGRALALVVAEQESTTERWIFAGVFVVVALVIAQLVDRVLSKRGELMANAVVRGELSAATSTRLRFVRRLIYAVIVLIGIAAALSQFDGVNRLAASLLASGAIAAAILGFAARQTLANVVAGIMLAVTQPIRVGDWIFVDDHYGAVEDIRLNYTFMRTVGGQQIVIPNEKLASGILRNDTLGAGSVTPEAHLWLPRRADARQAVDALADETQHEVTVAETTVDGFRLTVSGDPCPPPERASAEADLRLRCLERLRSDGLVPEPE